MGAAACIFLVGWQGFATGTDSEGAAGMECLPERSNLFAGWQGCANGAVMKGAAATDCLPAAPRTQ